MAKIKISDIAQLKSVYRGWKGLKKPSKEESRKRGYQLESMLEFLLADLEVKAAYKSPGEQIDGSFFMFGQTFLLEAKWHKDPLPVSEIYSFQGKVNGKFHTTSGIFVSYSGYSDNAVDALRSGKRINIILLDGKDMDWLIEHDIPFAELLKFKLRAAGDTGLPYVPFVMADGAAIATESEEIITVPSRYGVDTDVDLGESGTPMFLVVSTLGINERQMVNVFSELELHQSVSFQFKRILSDKLLVSTISTLSNLLAANTENNFMGVMLLVEDKQFSMEDEDYIMEVLHQNAIAIDILVIRVREDKTEMQGDEILSNLNILAIKSFMEQLLEVNSFFYNLGGARNVVRNELNEAEWDYEEKSIIFTDDLYGMPVTIDTFSDLVRYLTDIANNTAVEETPLEILKDADYDHDFEEIVYDVLTEYRTRLISLGWGDEI